MEEGRSDVKGKPHVHTRCQARETVNPITESEINALLQETERIIVENKSDGQAMRFNRP